MESEKEKVVKILKVSKHLKKFSYEELLSLVEIPPSNFADFAFPCFSLAKEMKMSPDKIALQIRADLGEVKNNERSQFSSIETKGPYINFILNKKILAEKTLTKILKEKDEYGKSNSEKGTIVVEFSSPNIAKPFGIGHLRSTIIGNSVANLAESQGYKVVRINYLGDWGTPFGKIIAGYKEFGKESELKKDPIKYLYKIYVKTSKIKKYETLGRTFFQKLEQGDKEVTSLWKKFRDYSLKDFERIYKLLNIKFDVYSGESFYEAKMQEVIKELESKKILQESEGAQIVNLDTPERGNLGVVLIKKSDNSTLYATRDLAAAIDRFEKYKFNEMFYEVGQEQQLHFKQIFKVLELMKKPWAKNLKHVSHGLYLDKDGKKFSTRKGKTLFMEDILNETLNLVKKNLQKEKLSKKEIELRALKIARSAIIYGDLKNYRENNMIFDINRFISFEGDTGPYLLYAYARASSIIRKSKTSKSRVKKHEDETFEQIEKQEELIKKISEFPQTLEKAYKDANPSHIANYAFSISKTFNEFYHTSKVIGSEKEEFKLKIVECFRQVLKNALKILGIDVIEEM